MSMRDPHERVDKNELTVCTCIFFCFVSHWNHMSKQEQKDEENHAHDEILSVFSSCFSVAGILSPVN